MKIETRYATLADDDVAYRKIIGAENFQNPIRCTYFLVVLFTQGSGVHYIDDMEFPIGKNQLHFLFPGQHHRWVTAPETVGQKLAIGQKLFESFSGAEEFLFIRNNLNSVFRLSDEAFNSVHNEMISIERDLKVLSQDQGWKQIINLRMDLLASLIKREAKGYINDKLLTDTHPVIVDFLDLINQHYLSQKMPGWYANQLCVTTTYLNVLCKKYLNAKATDMIHQRVLKEAKSSLKFSEKAIKEIAYDLGFENLSGFSAFFKKKTGFSPREYRAG
ncbi:MAG: AraC family transcriptional regulator [Niabella sp.]|nr:AraC family transcriptional regulator [Niabella sp.]